MIKKVESAFNKQNKVIANNQPTEIFNDQLPEKSLSSASLASSTFPWEPRKWYPRGQPIIVVPQQETGRQVEPTSFFLCFTSLLLLVSGGLLIGISIWALVYKIPYTYILDTSLFFIDSNGFPLCAGVISIPCWWIFWTCHNNPANYVFLPLAMVILAFNLTLLSAGAGLGIVNRSKMTFDYSRNPPKLTDGYYQKLIYDSMKNSLENSNYEYALDCLQRRHPTSCSKIDGGKLDDLYEKGCLDEIAFDLSFGICLVTGFSFIGILVQILALALACYVYVAERLLLAEKSHNYVSD